MTDLFAGRKVLITGGGSGIGTATGRLFAEAGAMVVLLDRDGEAAGRAATEIGGTAVTADVRDSEAMNAAIRQAAERMGGLTDLVNNAGTGMAKPLLDYTDKEWALLV